MKSVVMTVWRDFQSVAGVSELPPGVPSKRGLVRSPILRDSWIKVTSNNEEGNNRRAYKTVMHVTIAMMTAHGGSRTSKTE